VEESDIRMEVSFDEHDNRTRMAFTVSKEVAKQLLKDGRVEEEVEVTQLIPFSSHIIKRKEVWSIKLKDQPKVKDIQNE